MGTTICNATIRSARIGFDRDVFLTIWLDLDYGGSGQGFGGYVLGGDPTIKAGRHAEQANIAAEWLVRLMRVGGVESFADLKGQNVRVERGEGHSDPVIAVGHIVNDIWFRPKQDMAAFFPNETP